MSRTRRVRCFADLRPGALDEYEAASVNDVNPGRPVEMTQIDGATGVRSSGYAHAGGPHLASFVTVSGHKALDKPEWLKYQVGP